MPELISESITPVRASADVAAMARGEPGLPAAFTWRDQSYEVVEVLEQWKHSERESGRAGGELYLRRHYYKLRISDGSAWTVYFVRQTPKSGSAKRRWFLYTLDAPEARAVSGDAEQTRAVKLCPKVILEGTRLTHKTDIAFALNEHPRFVGPRKYRYHSPLVSGEWCGFTNTPWGRGLINFEPKEESQAMETYRTWMRLFELLRYYSWIVDRFHIATMAYQRRVHGSDHDFGWLEKRLVAVGFHLVFCTRTANSFAQARRERVKVSGNPVQYDDLDIFVREQEQLRELVARSRLPTLELDISDDDVAGAADRIVDWMAKSGGLFAIDGETR